MNRIAVILPPREQFSPQSAGAIGLLAHRLAAHEHTDQVTIIGAPCGCSLFPEVAFQPVARRTWPFWNPAERYASGVAAVLRDHPADLIEVHNRPEILPALARRFPTVPILLFLHNDPTTMRGVAAGARRARLVVAVSEWVKTRLVETVGILPRESIVLPNCIDLAEIPKPVAMADRDKVILFAGRVVADKGADLFVQACSSALPELPGWRAEMIGADRFGNDSPETPFLQTLRPIAEQAGIVLHGYKPHAEVLEAMSRAAITIVPSRWPEPFGLTALEAMGCGTALICSDRGALPAVVGDGGLLVSPEKDALTQSILALANNSCEREAMSAAGQSRATLFDVQQAAIALAALRRNMIASGPSNGD